MSAGRDRDRDGLDGDGAEDNPAGSSTVRGLDVDHEVLVADSAPDCSSHEWQAP